MRRFPYVYWRGKYCPLIEVEVINNDNRIRTLTYVDTGATYSIFHADFCEELDIELLSGERVNITVGDGGFIPIYLHDLRIRVENLEIDGRIGFSDRLGTGIDILGRGGILDDYLICFDGKNKEVLWHV